MKKTLLLSIIALIWAVTAFAQSPQAVKYQAVLRDNTGTIIDQANVDIRISIEANGNVVYQENHSTTTNQFGMVSLEIGTGSIISGTFSSIDWRTDDHFIRIEVDSGSGYTDMGTTQVLSVPYALHANTSGSTESYTETDPLFDASPAAGISSTHISDWDDAYLWGNHASSGYITDECQALSFSNDTLYLTGGSFVTFPPDFDGDWGSLTGTAPAVSTFSNDAGYIDTELDPSWHGLSDTASNIWRYGKIGIGISPLYKLHLRNNQNNEINLLYAHRTSDSYGPGKANNYAFRSGYWADTAGGSGYGPYYSDVAIKGYSYYGNNYTFGVHGANYNDYNRCGGVIGTNSSGSYFGSLAYKSSSSISYGGYFTSSTIGSGIVAKGSSAAGVGLASYGDMLGSWAHGDIIGQIVSGDVFSSYNLGNTYTSGTHVELVNTGSEKTAAYSVTSCEVSVYDKGFAKLSGNQVTIEFDRSYSNLLADERPVISITPIGSAASIYISSISPEGFTVAADSPQEIEFSWIAVGKRVDSDLVNNVPEALKSSDFDKNIKDYMFNESETTRNGRALWWTGNSLEFGSKLPEELIHTEPKKNPEQR
ncbi:MAG: hypothetical protein ACLFM1_07870 [Bacteroidales bacterium]